MPQRWSKAIICPMYRKGEKTQSQKYVGIALLGFLHKIFYNVCEAEVNRIHEQDKIGEYQKLIKSIYAQKHKLHVL